LSNGEAPMSVTFINWNSRAAIAVVAEERRLFAGSKWFAGGTLEWLNLNGHTRAAIKSHIKVKIAPQAIPTWFSVSTAVS
jgi:hypothetical protein